MQEYVFPQVPKDQFVKELNKLLKANGYTREGRRQHWTKQIETGFVLIFDVQGCWDCKGDYYVRAGVSIVGIEDRTSYGQFRRGIFVYSTEQVYNDALKYFAEWTDIMLVRERVQVIKEWRDRNPARYLWSLPQEKREKPPFPVPELETDIYDYVLSPKYLEDRKQFLKKSIQLNETKMQKYHEPYIPEKQLIEELKPILKQQGYLKTRKHWRKQLNEVFSLRFCVQTSMYDHNNYDVRVGVSVNIPWIAEDNTPYGQFFTNIFVSSGLQVYKDSVEYFKQWTDWKVLREKMFLLKQWREKYPYKYLQSLPREQKIEPPCQVPFGEPAVVEYVTSDEFKETCERLIGDKQLEISDDKALCDNEKYMLANDATDCQDDNVKYCLLCGATTSYESRHCPSCDMGIVVNKNLYTTVCQSMTNRKIKYIVDGADAAILNGKNKKFIRELVQLASEYYSAQRYNYATPLYMQSAILGNAEAQTSLGWCYEKGECVIPSWEKAAEWYMKAAKQGYQLAQHNLGVLYQNGIGVEQDYITAFKYFKKAAKKKLSDSQYNLAWCYEVGKGVQKNYKKAEKWYIKAARQGDAKAQTHLANCYCYGKFGQNFKKAMYWYHKAVKQGYPVAQDCLGVCYFYGYGVKQDYKKAVRLYENAAKQGYANAQNHLANCYKKGIGVQQNYEKAVKYYTYAARRGNADAQLNLGRCYYRGLGVSKDYDKAAQWFKKSAYKGLSIGQYNLGVCYYYGHGVEQSYVNAVKWYTRSALQGYQEAQLKLGDCYYLGQGVRKDYAKAAKWYSKSSEQGNADAERKLVNCMTQKTQIPCKKKE